MKFQDEKDGLTFIESQLATPPCINVIDKETFDERVHTVFNILWEKLSKSFGPGGAGTFISIYPNYYNTKDGFTIMKNIAWDKKLDQVISDMVMTVCSRLNFTVGDGTTTATIATKSTYDAYMEHAEFFKKNHILPREVLKGFENIKEKLLKKIEEHAINIRSDDPKVLRQNIEKVVYISSNGNTELTEMIGKLYEELMFPAISSVIAQDGVMKANIVDGYKIDINLTDKLYINNDSNTMRLNGADVILFDHRVGRDTYEKLLKPLSEASRIRGRHLICVAPFYDETALQGVIRTDLLAEYNKNKDVNLVLMVCARPSGYARTQLDDFAMLLNTTMVSTAMEAELMEMVETGSDGIYSAFDLDARHIPGVTVAYHANGDVNSESLGLATWKPEMIPMEFKQCGEKGLRVGYCDSLEMGLKMSTFAGFYYNDDMYKKYMDVAKEELAEIQKKCENVGSYSFDLLQKQQRVYSLGLKTGVIEVGSTSEISQNYLKDTVDDAIKAAASAYNNGVVLGCNVTMLQCIQELSDSEDFNTPLASELLKILYTGFSATYKTVLSNVFEDMPVSQFGKEYGVEIHSSGAETENIHDNIVQASVNLSEVFDLDSFKFSDGIINSAETDKEILKATIDLLSLLITGNQLVLC
jgi:chaperonin GroEL (HSP60 family)